MPNNNIWREAIVEELRNSAFNNGRNQGIGVGFRKGVFWTLFGLGCYRLYKWAKEDNELEK